MAQIIKQSSVSWVNETQQQGTLNMNTIWKLNNGNLILVIMLQWSVPHLMQVSFLLKSLVFSCFHSQNDWISRPQLIQLNWLVGLTSLNSKSSFMDRGWCKNLLKLQNKREKSFKDRVSSDRLWPGRLIEFNQKIFYRWSSADNYFMPHLIQIIWSARLSPEGLINFMKSI